MPVVSTSRKPAAPASAPAPTTTVALPTVVAVRRRPSVSSSSYDYDAADFLDENDPTEAIYEDQYILVTQGKVRLVSYYLPCWDKLIKIKDIVCVYYAPQQPSAKGFIARFGAGCPNIWWALDFLRNRERVCTEEDVDGKKIVYNVVIETANSCVYKGFSCEQIDEFLAAVRLQAGSDLVIQESLPL